MWHVRSCACGAQTVHWISTPCWIWPMNQPCTTHPAHRARWLSIANLSYINCFRASSCRSESAASEAENIIFYYSSYVFDSVYRRTYCLIFLPSGSTLLRYVFDKLPCCCRMLISPKRLNFWRFLLKTRQKKKRKRKYCFVNKSKATIGKPFLAIF